MTRDFFWVTDVARSCDHPHDSGAEPHNVSDRGALMQFDLPAIAREKGCAIYRDAFCRLYLCWVVSKTEAFVPQDNVGGRATLLKAIIETGRISTTNKFSGHILRAPPASDQLLRAPPLKIFPECHRLRKPIGSKKREAC